MAVLLITYKYNPKTSKADYDGFNQVISSYRWVKLSRIKLRDYRRGVGESCLAEAQSLH